MSKEQPQEPAPPYTPQVPSYQLNVEPQPQTAGWNPSIYPPPPPYTEPGYITQEGNITVIVQTALKDTPGLTVCPACHLHCITKTEYTSGSLTILLCFVLLFFGFILGCCFIPCCVNSCKDVIHYCPNCNHQIYKYKRI